MNRGFIIALAAESRRTHQHRTRVSAAGVYNDAQMGVFYKDGFGQVDEATAVPIHAI